MKKLIVFLLLFFVASYANEPITPIPQKLDYNPKLAKLGQKLFFDPILSRDRTIACVSCHDVATSGTDSRKTSLGVGGTAGSMNSPTVFNSVFNFAQFWNGRAKTLADQALGPIHNPVEMDLPLEEAASRLMANDEYRLKFFALFRAKKITPLDIALAIAEYEKTLITPNSKFDKYLRGEIDLDAREKEGYLLFKTLGCISCHNGVNLGGNSYQKMGVIYEYDTCNADDRYRETNREQDKGVFKVPTLRNISRTAPYLHDGSAETLVDAINKMSHHNLGVDLLQNEINLIVDFLYTLDGELPKVDLE